MLRILLATVASSFLITSALAQDGARAYFLLPDGINILSLDGTFVRTDIDGSEFAGNAVTPSYRKGVDFWGHAGSVLVGIPFGNVDASFPSPLDFLDANTPLAQGDMFVGAEVGLIGAPSLSGMAYAQYQPGLKAGVGARLYLPTGDYDSDRVVNLGGHRWSLQATLPISYALGSSLLDPNLTTFELVPMVHIFGDNDDPFDLTGTVNVVSQDPIWGVEGHVTRNFGQATWASLDAEYDSGGAIKTDGVHSDRRAGFAGARRLARP